MPAFILPTPSTIATPTIEVLLGFPLGAVALGMVSHTLVRWIGRQMVFWIRSERALTVGS